MPEHTVHTYSTRLPKKVMNMYKEFQETKLLEGEEGEVTAVHAGVLARKLLQLCTGAVYNEEAEPLTFHTARYELVIDLVAQREHSLVAFNWRHERENLVELAESRGISYAIIDGTVPTEERTRIVRSFQRGEIQTIFAHPQSAGHGLTLTKATSTIWCSPTYNSEHYTQFNRRIYRAGQTKRTETIRIAAEGTWEERVYDKLEGKVTSMNDLLSVLKEL